MNGDLMLISGQWPMCNIRASDFIPPTIAIYFVHIAYISKAHRGSRGRLGRPSSATAYKQEPGQTYEQLNTPSVSQIGIIAVLSGQ